MLFLRRFFHDVLPGALVFLLTLLFCLFSFADASLELNQASVLSASSYQEMLYSETPYSLKKEDTFADFASVLLVKKGKFSLSSDIYMVLPDYQYTSALPFYQEGINELKGDECMVSENVMRLRGIRIGDELENDQQKEKKYTVTAVLPAMKGYESEHHGIVVLGHDQYLEDYLCSVKGRYVSFSPHFDDIGMISVYGNIISKKKALGEAQGAASARIIAGALTAGLSILLVSLLYHLDDRRLVSAVYLSGGGKKDAFWALWRRKLLLYVLPVLALGILFASLNNLYLSASMVIAAILFGVALLIVSVESVLFIQRR